MIRHNIINVTLVVVSVGCLLICHPAEANEYFVYQPKVAMTGPIADRVQWIASAEPRFSRDDRQDGKIALVGGFRWKPTDYLTVSPQFKYVTKAKGTDADSDEYRPRLDVDLAGTAWPFKLAVRNRFEYRMKEGKDKYWRYRARLKVKFPKVGTVTPFVYEEVFYEFGDKNTFDRNEAGIGVDLPLGDRVSLETDLRLCHSRSHGKWGTGDIHLLSVLQYSF